MKIHEIKDNDGRVVALEISSSLRRQSLLRIIAAIPEAKLVKQRSLLGDISGEEDVCEFTVQGQKFKVCEPFGDNSEYWVGPEPPLWNPQVEIVKKTFCHAKKFLWFVYGLKVS